jgi:hypothetical protein
MIGIWISMDASWTACFSMPVQTDSIILRSYIFSIIANSIMPIIKTSQTVRNLREGKSAQIQFLENGKLKMKANKTLEGEDHWPNVQEELINRISNK